MLTKKKFLKGRIQTPWPIKGDAYTITGELIASSEAVEKSVYNFTNRRSPAEAFPEVAKDSRMVLYGLSDFIRTHLTQPLTHKQLDKCVRFMKKASIMGTPLQFNEATWRRVVAENRGYLPITIKALSEGLTFFPNEPVIQVSSIESGYGEIAAIIEAVMLGMVSIATARVTLGRHWLDRIRERIRHYNPGISEVKCLEIARWMIHDFGMRASSCAEESELLGRAHLLVFNGTDTFNAAYQATRLNNWSPVGQSVFALAHRIVQGHIDSRTAYERLREVASLNCGVGSYVADCYNFNEDVVNYLIPMAKANRADIVVVRPDSGDYIQNTLFVVSEAIKNTLYTQSATGTLAPTNLRFINGDSMNPDKVNKTWDELENLDVNPVLWGMFGVGGYLRNRPNRDSLSSAYKLCAKGKNNTPVIKLSEVKSKMSVPGPTVLIRRKNRPGFPSVFLANESEAQFNVSSLRTYYTGHFRLSPRDMFNEACLDSFGVLRERVLSDFDAYKDEPADRGSESNPVLSPTILKMQEEEYSKYRS